MAFLVVYYKKIGTCFQSSVALQVRPLEYEKSAILHLLYQTFSFCRNVLKFIKTNGLMLFLF